MQELAVIIVAWKVRDLLDRALRSLELDLTQAEVLAQVWVVDNDSRDGTAEMVRERYPWVNLLEPGRNLGFVGGNNLILRRLLESGDLPDAVWLLNPDTEVRAGATAALLEAFRRRPRAGLLTPKLLNPDGTLQPCAFRFPGLLQPLFDLGYLPRRFYASRWNGRYPRSLYRRREPQPIDHPLGAAMMARGEAVRAVGPLDDGFFMYCEEIDWAWRMRRAGWRSYLVPQAEVIHYGGASSGQVKPLTTLRLWESRARCYRKHRGPLTRALVGWAVRRRFRTWLQETEEAEWEAVYRRILRAWGEEVRG